MKLVLAFILLCLGLFALASGVLWPGLIGVVVAFALLVRSGRDASSTRAGARGAEQTRRTADQIVRQARKSGPIVYVSSDDLAREVQLLLTTIRQLQKEQKRLQHRLDALERDHADGPRDLGLDEPVGEMADGETADGEVEHATDSVPAVEELARLLDRS